MANYPYRPARPLPSRAAYQPAPAPFYPYISSAMPMAFTFPMVYPPYATMPLFSVNPYQFQQDVSYYGLAAPPPLKLSRPVLARATTRKDYLVSAVEQRENRLKTEDLPADKDLGPLRPEWIERLRLKAFGDPRENAEPMSENDDDDDDDPAPKRQRTAVQMQARAHHRRNFEKNGTLSKNKVDRISREVERKVNKAQVNYSVFKDFDFETAVKRRPNPIPPTLTLWDDDIPRSAQSADGINMAFYLPQFMTRNWTHTITEDLIHFGRYRSSPHFNMKAGDTAKYIKRGDELRGGLACVRGWNAIGSKRTPDKYKVAKEMVSTAEAHGNATDLLLDLGIVSHHCNAFLFHADRTHHDDALALRNIACNRIASQTALATIDPLIYEGREILFNRVSGEHTDTQDPPFAWAILAAFGHNTPVILTLSQLNLQMLFEPGDVIAIRGRVIKHKTSQWQSGQRIVIPHFTHSSTWDTFHRTGAFSRCDTS